MGAKEAMANWLKQLCGGVVTGTLLLSGATTSALTLPEAVRHTLDTNPQVLATRNQLSSREEEIRQARAGYLPTLDAAAGIGKQELEAPSTGNEKVRLTRHEASLSARQLVFDGFATQEEVARQEARHSSAFYTSLATEENTALRAAEVYINLLRQYELLDIARETLYEHQNIHDQMVLRNKSGVGSKADLDQIVARLALANSNLITAQNNLLDAQTNFYRVTGLQPQLDNLQTPSVNQPLPATQELAEAEALKEHPTLLSANADIDAAEAQYNTSESPMWPRLHLEADKSWDEDIDGVEGENRDWQVMLRMRYNLYNGGADSARRRQTAHLLEEAKDVRNNTQRQVVESLRLSWAAHQAISSQYKYLELHVRAATDTKAAYLKQFNIGRRTLLDLLNTENELVDARRALINASYDKLFSQYRIFNSMGQLVREIGVGKS